MLTVLYLYLCHGIEAFADEPVPAAMGTLVFAFSDWYLYLRFLF